MHSWLFGLVSLLTVASGAFAFDYQKIERKLNKEPKYASAKPEYGLLLFGREPKLRVWVVRDGKTLYLDRAGKGDLTDKAHRFAQFADCKGITLTDVDGKTKYTITGASHYEETKPSPRSALIVAVNVEGDAKFAQYCDLPLGDSPAKAGIAHFNGPLTAQPRTIDFALPPRLALKLGEVGTDLPLMIGTLDKAVGCWTVVRTHRETSTSAFPKDVVPTVLVEWPAAKNGDPPIQQRHALDQFC